MLGIDIALSLDVMILAEHWAGICIASQPALA
jgi:hypothetical protein